LPYLPLHQPLQRKCPPIAAHTFSPQSRFASRPSAISLRQLTVSGANHTRVLDPIFKASSLKIKISSCSSLHKLPLKLFKEQALIDRGIQSIHQA